MPLPAARQHRTASVAAQPTPRHPEVHHTNATCPRAQRRHRTPEGHRPNRLDPPTPHHARHVCGRLILRASRSRPVTPSQRNTASRSHRSWSLSHSSFEGRRRARRFTHRGRNAPISDSAPTDTPSISPIGLRTEPIGVTLSIALHTAPGSVRQRRGRVHTRHVLRNTCVDVDTQNIVNQLVLAEIPCDTSHRRARLYFCSRYGFSHLPKTAFKSVSSR